MEATSQAPITLIREELFEMVWKEPAIRIAERYKIPYPDFKKICDSVNVPIPGSGYWSKLRAGKPVPKPELPKGYTGPEKIKIEARVPKKKSSPISILLEDSKQGVEKLLQVPKKLTDPDKLIIAVKPRLEKPEYLHDGLAWPGSGNISISVAPKNAPRALRFMDTLIKLLKARGHNVRVENHSTYVIIEGEKLEVRLREKTNRSIIKEGSWERSVFTPSGILIFKLEDYPRKEWKDGSLLLEDRLEDIVHYLEQKGNEEKERRIKREIAQAERRERERIQRELEARQEKELSRFKILLQEAKRWKEVKELREYLADMRTKSYTKQTDPEAQEAWLEWAEKKANWYDPQVKAKDELLDAVDKETLTLRKKSGYYGW